MHHGTTLISKACVMVFVAVALAACAGDEALRDGPPPPESCASGEQLVCRSTTTSQMQRRNGRFCTCRPAPGLP